MVKHKASRPARQDIEHRHEYERNDQPNGCRTPAALIAGVVGHWASLCGDSFDGCGMSRASTSQTMPPQSIEPATVNGPASSCPKCSITAASPKLNAMPTGNISQGPAASSLLVYLQRSHAAPPMHAPRSAP